MSAGALELGGWRGSSRPGSARGDAGLLAAVRALARRVALTTVALCLPPVVLATAGPLHVLLGCAALAALAASSARSPAGRTAGWALDLAAAAGAGLLAVVLGPAALAPALAALAVRALRPGPSPAPVAAGLVAAGYALALLLAAPAPGRAAALLLPTAGLLLLAARALAAVAQRLAAHEDAAARGRELHRAGAALHQSASPDDVAAVVLASARGLLTRTGARVAVVLAPESGAGASEGGRALAALDEQERAALTAGTATTTHALRLAGDQLVPADGGGAEPVLLVPLCGRQRLRGVVALAPAPAAGAGGDWLPELESLAAQAAATLDTMLLTEDLLRSGRRFRALVQHSSDVIVLLDWQGSVRYVSPAVARMLGFPPAALSGQPFDRLVHPDDLEGWRASLQRVVTQRVQAPLSCRLRHHQEAWRHVEILATNLLGEPSVGGVVLNVRDVSERKALEDELRHRANHDALTGIPNRPRFLQLTADALAGDATRSQVAVLFIDLDGFKLVNDSFGHAAGDEVLLAVAERLRDEVPAPDVVARLSGDEFAVLLRRVAGEQDAVRRAEALLSALEQPFRVHNQVLRVSASVGVALGGTVVEDPEDLLHRADLAMYAAKASSRGGVEVLAAGTLPADGTRQLSADLQWAVLRGEFTVRYQPILRIADGAIAGAEALVRWRHPVKGLLGPDAFIPAAESSDLIGDVFEHVLRDACSAAVRWQELRPGSAALSVSVNLSAVQLQQPHLLDQVRAALDRSGLAPALLTLEITESVLVEDPRHAIETLTTLKRLGVRVAVDDFGTGYSSLAYLRRLPIDILKMDKIFLAGIDSRDGAPLAPTIIDLGKRLAMPTVAEGVERRGQLDALRRLGCDYAQGHLISRPVSAERLGELLAEPRMLTG